LDGGPDGVYDAGIHSEQGVLLFGSLKKQNPKYYYFEHGYFKPGGVG
jgi:hypothetical protein